MTTSVQDKVTAMAGAEALPRSNGELVFEQPWQARAFGVAVGLVQEQGLDWEEFRTRLIEEIGACERSQTAEPDETYSYYERWYAALERLVVEHGLATEAEIEEEVRHVVAANHHDHDHDHR
jgi:nitrile hydratase accessory protein